MGTDKSLARDGETIAYDASGDGRDGRDGRDGARAIVFAHNLMCDRRVFAGEAERLAAGARTINVDLRGHGGSTSRAPRASRRSRSSRRAARGPRASSRSATR